MRGRSSSVSVCCFFLAAIVILKEDSLVCGEFVVPLHGPASMSGIDLWVPFLFPSAVNPP